MSPAASDIRSIGAASAGSRRSRSIEHLSKNKTEGASRTAPIKKPILDQTIVCEDPASALNINDDQWNEIVQKNLKKFEDEKVQAK